MLGRPQHCRPALAPQELLARQRAQELVDGLSVVLGHRAEPVRPDDGAHHCGVTEQLLLGGRKQVDTCRDDPEDTVRKPPDVAAGRPHANELLRVERVPGGPLDHRRTERRVGGIATEERLDEAHCLARRERAERHGQRVALAASPARPSLEKLGTSTANDEQRDALHEIDEPVDEVQEAVVGPLQIVDHEHERSPARRAPRGRRRQPAKSSARRSPRPTSPGTSPTSGSQARHDPFAFCLGTSSATASASLRLRRRRVVVLVDSRLGLDDLAERPERHSVPVREAAAVTPRDDLLVVLDDLAKLCNEPALADPRDADERHELRSSGRRATAANAPRRSARSCSRPTSGAGRLAAQPADPAERLDRLPHLDGLRLALRVDERRATGRRPPARSLAASRSPTRMPSTGAAAWIRAAVFITSPATIDSPASGRASTRDERLAGRNADADVEVE